LGELAGGRLGSQHKRIIAQATSRNLSVASAIGDKRKRTGNRGKNAEQRRKTTKGTVSARTKQSCN